MQILNTQKIIINSIKIKENKKLICYSKHLGQGNYNFCVKKVYLNSPLF